MNKLNEISAAHLGRRCDDEVKRIDLMTQISNLRKKKKTYKIEMNKYKAFNSKLILLLIENQKKIKGKSYFFKLSKYHEIFIDFFKKFVRIQHHLKIYK